MARKKTITVTLDDADQAGGFPAAPAGALLPATTMDATSLVNGTVHRTGIISADPGSIAVIVEEAWKNTTQEEIDEVTAERKKAAARVTELELAYRKATAAVPIPATFVADVEALAAAFRPFEADAVAGAHGSRKALRELTPMADATEPLPGVSFGHGSRPVMIVEADIRADGHAIRTVRRELDLPATVAAAHKAWTTAQVEVTKLDGRLVELAKIKQQAGEKGRAVYASAAATVFNTTPEGREVLETIGKVTAHLGRKAGLKHAGSGNDILALTANKSTDPAAAE